MSSRRARSATSSDVSSGGSLNMGRPQRYGPSIAMQFRAAHGGKPSTGTRCMDSNRSRRTTGVAGPRVGPRPGSRGDRASLKMGGCQNDVSNPSPKSAETVRCGVRRTVAPSRAGSRRFRCSCRRLASPDVDRSIRRRRAAPMSSPSGSPTGRSWRCRPSDRRCDRGEPTRHRRRPTGSAATPGMRSRAGPRRRPAERRSRAATSAACESLDGGVRVRASRTSARPGGGTGRRRGLKPLGPSGRVSSNLTPGTLSFQGFSPLPVARETRSRYE